MTTAGPASPGQPETPGEQQITAVVLAGGASRRFGSDKLIAPVGGVPLLDHAIAELPRHWPVILVGPERQLSGAVLAGRTVITVRERPVGSGPAAALVTGINAALAGDGGIGAAIVVTLPGDAPAGGGAARALVAALLHSGPESESVPAVVGVDVEGFEQPLQFAARAAALGKLATRTDTDGLRARSLLADLGDYRRLPLPVELTADVDTTEDLARWHR